MTKLKELYEVIDRMMEEGRGEADIYFSDGEKYYPIEKLDTDKELDSEIIMAQ